MLQYCENIVFWRKLYGQIFKKSRRGGGNHDKLTRCLDAFCLKKHRGVDAKRQSLLRLGDFDLYKKFVDILSLFKRNILISPLEGEKKFLSEFCELRNFREGYKKPKNTDRATECAMTCLLIYPTFVIADFVPRSTLY